MHSTAFSIYVNKYITCYAFVEILSYSACYCLSSAIMKKEICNWKSPPRSYKHERGSEQTFTSIERDTNLFLLHQKCHWGKYQKQNVLYFLFKIKYLLLQTCVQSIKEQIRHNRFPWLYWFAWTTNVKQITDEVSEIK